MDSRPTENNNLKKFGKEFQSKCLAVLMSNRAFLERIVDILQPEYFETEAQKWITNLTIEYFNKYREIPTISVFQVEIKKIENEVLQASLIEQVKTAYGQVSTAIDKEYVKEQFLEFCKNQKLKHAILKASDHLKAGDYESIWNVINEASKAGMERNLGHDYFAEFDARMSEEARRTIKTNWEVVDGHLDGGLGDGELGFIVAPAGSGKSWFLSRIGTEALRQGKNVVHFTMELNEKYVGRRYDSCFSGIQFQKVRESQQEVKKSLENINGRLFVKYFPMNTATSTTLRSYIERLQLINKIKIDMMVVDYADLLRPTIINKSSNSYEDGGSIYGDLRSLAGELQIPTWSASQSNRGAHEEQIVGALNVADSYKKIMIGDFIMSLSRTMEDKSAGTGRIMIIKSRFGSDGQLYPCSFDASCGKIGIFDESSIEGKEVMSKVSSQKDAMKEILGKRWKQTHKDDAE